MLALSPNGEKLENTRLGNSEAQPGTPRTTILRLTFLLQPQPLPRQVGQALQLWQVRGWWRICLRAPPLPLPPPALQPPGVRQWEDPCTPGPCVWDGCSCTIHLGNPLRALFLKTKGQCLISAEAKANQVDKNVVTGKDFKHLKCQESNQK